MPFFGDLITRRTWWPCLRRFRSLRVAPPWSSASGRFPHDQTRFASSWLRRTGVRLALRRSA